VLQADVCHLPFRPGTFDAIWSGNTLHHVPDPVAVLQEIQRSLVPGGVLAIGESSYLPDMLFAWDSRLERLVNEAVRAYYRDRYGRSETELAGIRAWVGRMRQAGFLDVAVRTVAIERISPLDQATRDYVQECLFDGTFRGRLSGYLGPEDHDELEGLMDPHSPQWALGHRDFHFLQTFTVTWGRKATA
jgi:SAM-dependent methyltransferase